MPIAKHYKQFIREAHAPIRTLSLEEAGAKHANSDAIFIDIRDKQELEREGMIPGRAPRGMLEFCYGEACSASSRPDHNSCRAWPLRSSGWILQRRRLLSGKLAPAVGYEQVPRKTGC